MHIYHTISSSRKPLTMATSNTLTFSVSRQHPELIPPAKPTPHEFKPLSNIDDQEGLRFQAPTIQFYRRNPSMDGKDPVKVIRDAIAKALVFYYPLAGRLRETTGRKLVVECTGEGVLFIEADADVTLRQFGDVIYPPFPCLEELLYDVPGSTGITDSPLLLIQVTRLKCKGFIFATRTNHTICDSVGAAQFMSAIIELARGAKAPSIPPVWERHLLNARNQLHVSFTHHEYDVQPPIKHLTPYSNNQHDATLLLLRVKRHLCPPPPPSAASPSLLQVSSLGCLYLALPDHRCLSKPQRSGQIVMPCKYSRASSHRVLKYYGNAMVFPPAVTTSEKLLESPLHYAVELIMKAKSEATEEYIKSVADLMMVRGRPNFTVIGTYMMVDLTHSGFDEIDFGWGKPVYGGLAKINIDIVPGATSFLVGIKNDKGENEIFVPISLPLNAMKVFVDELELLMETARRSSVPTSAL